MWVLNINKISYTKARYFLVNNFDNTFVDSFEFDEIKNNIISRKINSIFLHINGFSVFQGFNPPGGLTKNVVLQKYQMGNHVFYGAIKRNEFFSEMLKWYGLEIKINSVFVGDGLGLIDLEYNTSCLFGSTIFSIENEKLNVKNLDDTLNFSDNYLSKSSNVVSRLKKDKLKRYNDFVIGRFKVLGFIKTHNFLNYAIRNSKIVLLISFFVLAVTIGLALWSNLYNIKTVQEDRDAKKNSLKNIESAEKYQNIVEELSSFGIENKMISTVLLNDIFEQMPTSIEIINIDLYPEEVEKNAKNAKNFSNKKFSNSVLISGFYSEYNFFENWMENIKEIPNVKTISFLEFKQSKNLIRFTIQLYL